MSIYISTCCQKPIYECPKCEDAKCTECHKHCDVMDALQYPEYLTPEQRKEIDDYERQIREQNEDYYSNLLPS